MTAFFLESCRILAQGIETAFRTRAGVVMVVDHTKQVNHAFFECFPQTHGLPSFYSLWQTLAGRAINDTQPFALSSCPIAKRRSFKYETIDA